MVLCIEYTMHCALTILNTNNEWCYIIIYIILGGDCLNNVDRIGIWGNSGPDGIYNIYD